MAEPYDQVFRSVHFIQYFVAFCFVLCLFTGVLYGQSSEAAESSCPACAEALVSAGFENVRVARLDGQLVAAYENRRYRSEYRALNEALALLAPLAGTDSVFVLAPLHEGIPMGTVTYRRSTGGSGAFTLAETTVAANESQAMLKEAATSNRSFGKIDLLLQPFVSARFGNYEDPVENEAGILPEVTTTLWKGFSLRAQVMVPFIDEYEHVETGIRPGIVTATQTARLPYSTFVSLSAGRFTEQRYGLDLSGRTYLAGGRVAVQARLGRTGYARYDNAEWTYGGINRWTYTAGVTAFYPKLNVSLGVQCGRYVYQDNGCRVDVDREFGELSFGFFGMTTQWGDEAGFRLRVPLVFNKYSRPAFVRVRTARYFKWEYRYKGLDRPGIPYDSGLDFETYPKETTIPFIRNHVPAESRAYGGTETL